MIEPVERRRAKRAKIGTEWRTKSFGTAKPSRLISRFVPLVTRTRAPQNLNHKPSIASASESKTSERFAGITVVPIRSLQSLTSHSLITLAHVVRSRD